MMPDQQEQHYHHSVDFSSNIIMQFMIWEIQCINKYNLIESIWYRLRNWFTPSTICLGTQRQIFALVAQSGGSPLQARPVLLSEGRQTWWLTSHNTSTSKKMTSTSMSECLCLRSSQPLSPLPKCLMSPVKSYLSTSTLDPFLPRSSL